MATIITVGLDLAKNVFQVHGADAAGRAVLRKKLRRDQALAFFGDLPTCVVAMEACGGAHFWGREIGKIGHDCQSALNRDPISASKIDPPAAKLARRCAVSM